jgi:hypothetical protein
MKSSSFSCSIITLNDTNIAKAILSNCLNNCQSLNKNKLKNYQNTSTYNNYYNGLIDYKKQYCQLPIALSMYTVTVYS